MRTIYKTFIIILLMLLTCEIIVLACPPPPEPECYSDSDCSACQYCSSGTCVAVGVASVTSSKDNCWEGDQITFTASPNPSGASFASGGLTWSASAGSFPYGNTGTSVTWQAPSNSGGYATITATCSSSSANKGVTYTYVNIGDSGLDLMRSDSHSFYASVTPSESPVSFYQNSSTSEFLSVSNPMGFLLDIDNLIEESDIESHIDNATAWIEAHLPDNDMKLFGKNYNLKKYFHDQVENVEICAGQYAYNWFKDEAKDFFGNGIRSEYIAMGLSPERADEMKSFTETGFENLLTLLDPFPGTIEDTDSIINESTTYDFTLDVSMTIGTGTITIFPKPEMPSPGEFIAYINQHGIDSKIFDFDGFKIVPTWKITGTNWGVIFGGYLKAGNNDGEASVGVGGSAYWGF
jgi:hypothetical protein